MITLFGSLIITVYKKTTECRVKLQRCIDGIVAFEHIMHDVECLDGGNDVFKKVDKDTFICAFEKYYRQWLVKNNRLLRYEGFFNVEKSVWKKRSVSLVLGHIRDIAFTVANNRQHVMVGIHVMLVVQGDAIEGFHALRIGINV